MHALPTAGWRVEMLETLPDDGELFVTPALVSDPAEVFAEVE